jgi:hypothetical protein
MMKPDLRNSTFEVRRIGETALGMFSSARSGIVLAAVTKAVYLLDEQDELFWLTAEPGPMHRRCLQVSAPIPRLTVGTKYQVQKLSIETSSGDVLDFHRSVVWESPTIPLEKVVAVAKLAELVDSVYGRLLAQHEPAGWGRWIPTILSRVQFRENDSSHPEPAAESILLACRSRDPRAVPGYVAELVGRGEGLTPSGDDFLGGLFFCFHILRAVYPEILDSSWNYSTFIQQFKPRTNLISFTLLKDHAEGHALEPLHRFASALLQGQPADHILPFAEELIRVGQSTGWDLLTGFLTGMLVTFPA